MDPRFGSKYAPAFTWRLFKPLLYYLFFTCICCVKYLIIKPFHLLITIPLTRIKNVDELL